MAITLDYSPISSALALATQAGIGQRNQQMFENGVQQSQLSLQAQRELDERNARQIELSLQGQGIAATNQRANAELAMAGKRLDTENDYRNKSLAALSDYREGTLDQRAQNADALSNYRGSRLDIQQQQADAASKNADANTTRANTPRVGASHDMQALESEYGRLSKQEAFVAKQMKQFAYDPNDPTDLLAQPSQAVHGAKAGFEARFADAQRSLTAVQQRRQQIEEGLRQRIDPLLNAQQQGSSPAPSPAAPAAPQQASGQQSAPSQPRIVQTATNPQTGQRIGFDAISGQWVSIQ